MRLALTAKVRRDSQKIALPHRTLPLDTPTEEMLLDRACDQHAAAVNMILLVSAQVHHKLKHPGGQRSDQNVVAEPVFSDPPWSQSVVKPRPQSWMNLLRIVPKQAYADTIICGKGDVGSNATYRPDQA